MHCPYGVWSLVEGFGGYPKLRFDILEFMYVCIVTLCLCGQHSFFPTVFLDFETFPKKNPRRCHRYSLLYDRNSLCRNTS